MSMKDVRELTPLDYEFIRNKYPQLSEVQMWSVAGQIYVPVASIAHLLKSLNEMDQSSEIKIGDEVLASETQERAVFLMSDEDGEFWVLDWEGLVYPTTIIKKTGRHFPQLEELLSQLRGE